MNIALPFEFEVFDPLLTSHSDEFTKIELHTCRLAFLLFFTLCSLNLLFLSVSSLACTLALSLSDARSCSTSQTDIKEREEEVDCGVDSSEKKEKKGRKKMHKMNSSELVEEEE